MASARIGGQKNYNSRTLSMLSKDALVTAASQIGKYAVKAKRELQKRGYQNGPDGWLRVDVTE